MKCQILKADPVCTSNECYVYKPSGPNSNTAWYTTLKECSGVEYDPPRFQPGRLDDFSEARKCKE